MGHVLPPPEKAPDQAEEAPLGADLARHRGADPPCLFTGGRQGLGLVLELQPPAPLGRCDADRPLRPSLTAAQRERRCSYGHTANAPTSVTAGELRPRGFS